MNWGWKISIVYILFAGMILTLVYKATQEDYPLVTTDYYAKEKAQQGKIDAAHRVKEENAQVKILFQQSHAVIHFPASAQNDQKQIEIYCAYNPSLDQTLSCKSDSLVLPLKKGKYIIKSSWVHQSKNYYQENELIIKQ
ncbi:MAG: hypothetical protein RL609_1030 [Bacteroidota bacterium]|jgi:hypothetical protein